MNNVVFCFKFYWIVYWSILPHRIPTLTPPLCDAGSWSVPVLLQPALPEGWWSHSRWRLCDCWIWRAEWQTSHLRSLWGYWRPLHRVDGHATGNPGGSHWLQTGCGSRSPWKHKKEANKMLCSGLICIKCSYPRPGVVFGASCHLFIHCLRESLPGTPWHIEQMGDTCSWHRFANWVGCDHMTWRLAVQLPTGKKNVLDVLWYHQESKGMKS